MPDMKLCSFYKKLQQVKYVQCREKIAQAKLVGWMLVTWSSRRAFIPIFFLPRESKKLSTDIGSNRASGPSSEIGGTVSGCKYNLGEKICMRNRKAILRVFKYNLWKIPTSSNKRTLAKRRLSVKENSKPSSSYKSNQKVTNNKVQNQHPTSCFFLKKYTNWLVRNWNEICAFHSLNWIAIKAAIRDETEINQ